MAHVAKYTRGALGNMLKHYHRDKKKDGSEATYGNQSIDRRLTHLNQTMIQRGFSDLEFIQRRMDEVHYQDRKDLKVMADWVLTAPQDLRFTDEERLALIRGSERSDSLNEKVKKLDEFFKVSFDFLAERYGRENVINANVHYDETSPHMHFYFMPIVHDRKKVRGKDDYIDVEKINAKKCLPREELMKFHKDLQQALDERLSFKTEIFKEVETINLETGEIERVSATKLKGNKTINQIKAENAQLEVDKARLEAKISQMEGEISQLNNDKRVIYKEITEYVSEAKTYQSTVTAVAKREEDARAKLQRHDESAPIGLINKLIRSIEGFAQSSKEMPQKDARTGENVRQGKFTLSWINNVIKALNSLKTHFKEREAILQRAEATAEEKAIINNPPSLEEKLAMAESKMRNNESDLGKNERTQVFHNHNDYSH